MFLNAVKLFITPQFFNKFNQKQIIFCRSRDSCKKISYRWLPAIFQILTDRRVPASFYIVIQLPYELHLCRVRNSLFNKSTKRWLSREEIVQAGRIFPLIFFVSNLRTIISVGNNFVK